MPQASYHLAVNGVGMDGRISSIVEFYLAAGKVLEDLRAKLTSEGLLPP